VQNSLVSVVVQKRPGICDVMKTIQIAIRGMTSQNAAVFSTTKNGFHFPTAVFMLNLNINPYHWKSPLIDIRALEGTFRGTFELKVMFFDAGNYHGVEWLIAI